MIAVNVLSSMSTVITCEYRYRICVHSYYKKYMNFPLFHVKQWNKNLNKQLLPIY